jgi:F-type H+-transporting ATPase subunit a
MSDSESISFAVQEFIEHHVMRHTGAPDGWNLPFVHIDALEWFKYDSAMLVFVVLVLVVLGIVVRRKYGSVPRGIAMIAEIYVLFIRDHITYANLGKDIGRQFVSFFCTLFIFIFTGNVLGLIPIFNSVTGNVSVTAGLATMFMAVSLVTLVRLRGFAGFKGAFVPHGLPVWLTPLMTVMEVISYLTRIFALTIRLFCNMLAGHVMIYSLLGLLLIFGWMAFPVVAVAAVMYLFELFIAFLQAYIFTLLAAIFINMMVNPSHG